MKEMLDKINQNLKFLKCQVKKAFKEIRNIELTPGPKGDKGDPGEPAISTFSIEEPRHPYILNDTGRMYLYKNLWRGVGLYGNSYYHLSTSKGSGSNPAYSYTRTNGILVAKDSVVEEIHISLYSSNNDKFIAEYDISELTADNTINTLARFKVDYNQGRRHRKTIFINEPVLEGSLIVYSSRKIEGDNGSNFSYYSLALQLINQ